MENLCKVTQYQNVVNNDNLPVFNSITFDKIPTLKTDLVIGPISLIRVIEGDAHLYDSNNNDLGTETNAGTVYLPANTTAKVRIYNKYGLTYFKCLNCNSPEVTRYLDYLSEDVTRIQISAFGDPATSPGFNGDVDSLPAYQHLEYLEVQSGMQYHVNIESLSKFPSLTGARMMMNNTLEGDIVEMVKKYVRGGRTQGTIDMGGYNYSFLPARGIKFDGSNLVGNYMNITLAWSTSSGTTTVTLSSTTQETLTATFTL